MVKISKSPCLDCVRSASCKRKDCQMWRDWFCKVWPIVTENARRANRKTKSKKSQDVVRRTAVCDKDCFHCKFSDCILDKVDPADAEREERVVDAILDDKTKKIREKNKKYYNNHRDELLKKRREWTEKNYAYVRQYRRERRYKKLYGNTGNKREDVKEEVCD